jgi:Protein of unknown function (DUF4232)
MSGISASSVLIASLVVVCAGCAVSRQTATAQQQGPATATAVPAPSPTSATASPRRPATAVTPPPKHAYGTRCQPAQLRLTLGPKVSEATQQHTAVLVLTNVSAAGCDLWGYPGVALFGHHGALLPFSYRRSGDQMLTGAAPALVPLRPGAAAYFGINQQACFAYASGFARRIQVIPPGDHAALSRAMRRFPTLFYCRAGPGHTIDLTPLEPSLRDLANRH